MELVKLNCSRWVLVRADGRVRWRQCLIYPLDHSAGELAVCGQLVLSKARLDSVFLGMIQNQSMDIED